MIAQIISSMNINSCRISIVVVFCRLIPIPQTALVEVLLIVHELHHMGCQLAW